MRTASPSTSARSVDASPVSDAGRALLQLGEVEVLILQDVRQLVRDRHAVLDVERRAAHEDLLRGRGRSRRASPTTCDVSNAVQEVDLAADEAERAEHRLLARDLGALRRASELPSAPSCFSNAFGVEIADRDRVLEVEPAQSRDLGRDRRDARVPLRSGTTTARNSDGDEALRSHPTRRSEHREQRPRRSTWAGSRRPRAGRRAHERVPVHSRVIDTRMSGS